MKQSLTKLLVKKMELSKEGWNKNTQGPNPMLEKKSQRECGTSVKDILGTEIILETRPTLAFCMAFGLLC